MTIPVTHIMKDQKTDNWIATLKCGETEMIVEDCKLDALTENIKKIHCITTQNIR